MRKLMSIAGLLFFGVGLFFLPAAYASMDDMADKTGSVTLESLQASPSKDADGTIHMNNDLCPVSGDKINPKSTVTQDGVTCQMCCAMCASKIQKHPEKYTVAKPAILAKLG